MSSFDPNGVGIANGNIFGFPCKEDNADIVLVPVPWDATASYGKGTSQGPQAILEASTQLDFFHPELPKAYQTKVFMSAVSDEWLELNEHLSSESKKYLSYIEEFGEQKAREKFGFVIEQINSAQNALCENLKERCLALLRSDKTPCVLGGEHSSPLGLLLALDEVYEEFGILQIDAHADLRQAYEGFEQSHASIMYNALNKLKHLIGLTQVGIRDLSQNEYDLAIKDPRIHTFFDWDIKKSQFQGKTWAEQVNTIIESLPQKVYISFDIDGLNPNLCPNTGTPVPGGFEMHEIVFLIFHLVNSGKQIIGFDLCEVAPGSNNDWDANVGARVLWHLVCATESSRRTQK